MFLANPNPPRLDGQAKHAPFTTILVVILQLGADEDGDEDVTQFPPCLLPTHVEGGMHPH